MTYAGIGRNIEHMGLERHPRYAFHRVDICDSEAINIVFAKECPDIVVHFAAESHVDRSIKNASEFVMTNVVGTQVLLDAAVASGVKRFVQISTDEVYGSLGNDDPSSVEGDIFAPRSPYAASKAAAEHLALSYWHTHHLPVIVTRSSNNFGPYQFPEKLIPLFVTNLIDGKKVPLMYSPENPGLNVRDWLYVEDNCEAIWYVTEHGAPGETYNIGGGNERTNIQITRALLSQFGMGEDMIQHVPHRKGHDFRYSLSTEKLCGHGFRFPQRSFDQQLALTIDWYRRNESWWRPLKKA